MVGAFYRFEIDPKTRQTRKRILAPSLHMAAFDAINESRRGRAYRYAWFTANNQHEGQDSSVCRVDTQTGEAQVWTSRERLWLRQPRLSPTGPGEDEGYLVVPCYTYEETRLLVFDARDIAKGPVTVLSAGERLPYSNHGWVEPAMWRP